MKQSIYTKIGIIVKALTGIEDISLFRKNVKKRIGKVLYHKKYEAKDVVAVMKDMGLKRGVVCCIHSSMKEFYNYRGTAKDLIEEILKELGSDGTLMMPAFPKKSIVNTEGYIFDLDNDATGAGYLAEEFRKYPGVKRSINVQHSVCAIGKYADFLTKDHYKCHDCWGEGSPWRRLCELGGIVFNLGMPRSYIGTFDHCVESELQYMYPYWAQFFTKKVRYAFYSQDREISYYESYQCEIDCRTRESRVSKYFDKRDWSINKISNLEIKAYYTQYCYPKMLELGKKGICIYYVPNPKHFFK